jgi:aminoglycoside phosphotransferase (APT) family kinase protein
MVRARQVLHRAGVGSAGDLQRAPSLLNEVWYLGDYVMRISADPERGRLAYEAALAPFLPPEIGYPEVITGGRDSVGEWLILKRLNGSALSRSWPDMRESARRHAVSQLAVALKALHSTPAPVTAEGPLLPPFWGTDTLDCPHQLPVERLVELCERAEALPNVDRSVLQLAALTAMENANVLDPDPYPTLVHGDLHFENVLWDGHDVGAVLDFEFARPGPADLDLDVILRFCADPGLHVADDYAHLAKRSDYRDVPWWLKEEYPELFNHPRLIDRLTVYSLAYEIRHLLLMPPQSRAEADEPFHPYNRLRKLVERRSHLQWLEI